MNKVVWEGVVNGAVVTGTVVSMKTLAVVRLALEVVKVGSDVVDSILALEVVNGAVFAGTVVTMLTLAVVKLALEVVKVGSDVVDSILALAVVNGAVFAGTVVSMLTLEVFGGAGIKPWQFRLDVEPTCSEDFPAGQSRHELAARVSEYFPRTQI